MDKGQKWIFTGAFMQTERKIQTNGSERLCTLL